MGCDTIGWVRFGDVVHEHRAGELSIEICPSKKKELGRLVRQRIAYWRTRNIELVNNLTQKGCRIRTYCMRLAT